LFKPHVQDQGELFPPRVGELIPDDDLCRVVSEVVDRLDLSSFALNYSPLGQNAYSPNTMLKLLFYGYSIGVRSSRAIEDKACFEVRFRWLAGNDRPHKSAIADFRNRNLARIEELFVQVILLCRELGMVKFGHWAIDGTKLKANAGKNAMRKRESIDEELAGLRRQIRDALAEAKAADDDEDDDEPLLPPSIRRKQERQQRLEQALKALQNNPERKRANTTDPDAPLMKRKGGGYEPCYNPQLTVDVDSQVVLAADVCTDQNDACQLVPQLDQAAANAGGKPACVSADTGYASGNNLAAVKQRGIQGYIPPREESVQQPGGFKREDFRYEPERDRFICPAGKEMTYRQTKIRHTATGSYQSRKYLCRACEGCQQAPRCLAKGAKYRSMELSEHEPLFQTMRERLSTPEGKAIYDKRKQSVEPAIGVAKWTMGVRSFLLRGVKKARSEWRLTLTAFNIRKIWSSGKLVAPTFP
jgi:transposase